LVRALAILFATTFFWTAAGAQDNDVIDLSGQPVNPFSSKAKAVVFLFVKTDCPISNRYAPEVKRLCSQFARKGVLFWLVYPDSSVSPEAIRKHAKEYDYPCAILRDPSHSLVQLCKAQVTPEAAVLTPDRQLVYHGRIDDRYVTFGKSRPAPTRRDLQEALTALLDSKPIPSSEPAIGCAISPAK
jgi:peroxiredoxin